LVYLYSTITTCALQTIKISALKPAKGYRRWIAYIAYWVDENRVENFDQKNRREKTT
jgi:hypothetical protein